MAADIKLDINPDFYVGSNLDTGCGCGCLPRGEIKRRGKNKKAFALGFAFLLALVSRSES